MKNKFALPLIICLLVIFSCSNPNQTKTKLYFDLEKFMNDQVKVLSTGKLSIVKEISVDSSTKETQTFENLDSTKWQNELQPFIDADINKPAWRGRFTIDTTFMADNSDSEMIITYQTDANDIKTKKLELHYDMPSEMIIEIEIHNLTDNILYHFDQQLFYFPKKKYFIKTSEKVVLLHPTEVEVDGKIK